MERVVNDLQNYKKSPNGAAHVNFRDTKLTRILQPFLLSGKGSSVFILCVSPLRTNAQETLNTMKFGQRLQGISKPLVQQAPASPPLRSPGGFPATEVTEAGCPMQKQHQGDQGTLAHFLGREFAWSLLAVVLYASISSAIDALWC